MKGRVRLRHTSSPSSYSTSLSMQLSSYIPMLFRSFSFLLSAQKGSRIVKISGGFTVSLRKTRARAVRYLQSRSPRQSSQIYRETFICSILNKRHKNLVGFLEPPYRPPIHLSSNARSINVCALSAKHFSFQQRLLKIRLRVVLSMSWVRFFMTFQSLLRVTLLIYILYCAVQTN